MSERPDVNSSEQGSLTAAIEISPTVVSIGIIARYEIPFLLEVQVPASAVFPMPPNLDQWSFDMGSLLEDRYVSVRFMQSIRADGYFMVHGGDIKKAGVIDLPGIAVAAGINAALTWGVVDIGLYIRVAVSANIGLSFKPKLLIGQFSLSGELHLFIVSIGASATAKFMVGEEGGFYVFAEVSGSVDFFFFEVSGSVELSLGSKPQLPGPPVLIRALSLHARSHALMPGSGADGGIDGAIRAGEPVPIDAIPVLEFEMRAVVEKGTTFLKEPITSWLDKSGHVQRGERLYRYRLSGVSLAAMGHVNPVIGEETPVVWWDDRNRTAPDSDTAVQLALLCAVPNPTPNAAIRTQTRDEWMTQRWGDLCKTVSSPRSVLWTFGDAPVGGSIRGWTQHGLAYPPDGEMHSKEPPTRLRVTEPWRSHPSIDPMLDVSPAYVRRLAQLDIRFLVSPVTGISLRPLDPALLTPEGLPQLDDLADAVRLDAGPLRRIRGAFYAPDSPGAMAIRLRKFDGSYRDLDPYPYSKVLQSPADMPEEWKNDESGWASAIVKAGVMANFGSHEKTYLFDIDNLDGVVAVEIGRTGAGESEAPHPPWVLFAFDAVTEGEYRRARIDEEGRDTTISVIDGTLTGDAGKRALLHPATEYKVTATYQVDYADLDDDGTFKWETGTDNLTQDFSFITASDPPDRLDGLVLATTPAADEQYVFCGDPITIVFSSKETRQLYAAYGHTLTARVRAASGNHPTPHGDDLKIDAVTIPPKPWPNIALSPFDFALGELIKTLPCVNDIDRAERHDAVTIALPLAPLTNYMLDLGTDQFGEPLRPLLRRNFSTSRYASAAAFAADMPRTPAHRHIDHPERLPGSATVLSDLAFDEMLRAIRWGDMRRTRTPKVTVIWSGPTAVALLLDTSEPHWRTRQVPVQAPTGELSLGLHDWLTLDDAASGGIAAGFIRSTDGSRTLVRLNNARGATLRLDLKRIHTKAVEGDDTPQTFPLAFTIGTPPWEAAR